MLLYLFAVDPHSKLTTMEINHKYQKNRRINILSVVFVFFVAVFSIPNSFAFSKPVKLDSTSLAVKTIEARRIEKAPDIDAVMSEDFWKEMPIATDFVEYTPRNGTQPPFRTEIRFAYDDAALYIFATMYDPYPDSICKEMGRRDQIENLYTDYISFDILPYNDGLNMYEFKVSPAGLQNDCKYSAIGQDVTWDAVWESAAKINSDGWTVEIKLPYSALRFPKTDKQLWGINMWRNLRRTAEWSTWTFVDNKTQDVLKYYGTLTGIENIDPPARLSISPYLAGYTEKFSEHKSWNYSVKGGLDVRFGLNEAYTVDMMLIPDFGQVQSDDVVLNLTPYEVKYNEKRQFFTEATELFDKCEIFYSRRIGSTPNNYYLPFQLAGENERLLTNPDQTRIINATKLSGRNTKGLGVGIFNAMTSNTFAELQNTETNEVRKIKTQAFTNYNVLVADQNLKNNSYITIINTNYSLPAEHFSANVSGMESKLTNKNNTFSFLGRFNLSQKYFEGDSNSFGHQYLVAFSKPSGKFQYRILRQQTGSTYDPNDMGFLLRNNEAINKARLTYSIQDPFWIIRNTYTEFITMYSSLVKPGSFTDLYFTFANYSTFTNFWSNNIELAAHPLGMDDYFEPRVQGKVYKRPASYGFTWNVNTDGRRKFRYSNGLSVFVSPENKNSIYVFEATPRMRFSDRFLLTISSSIEKSLNDFGWVNAEVNQAGSIISWFGRRNVTTISNIVNFKYIFNTKTSLTLRGRHYWSQAEYFDFYELNSNGNLDKKEYLGTPNINFNALTADLNFGWYFAPGSEITVVWKNSIFTQGEELISGYFKDLRQTLASSQLNGFSIKLLYYIDYVNVASKIKQVKR